MFGFKMNEICRRVTKQQRKDQSVSCICLDLLSAVVHYLGDDELPSKTIADCRDIAVHLLSAFWLVDISPVTSDIKVVAILFKLAEKNGS